MTGSSSCVENIRIECLWRPSLEAKLKRHIDRAHGQTQMTPQGQQGVQKNSLTFLEYLLGSFSFSLFVMHVNRAKEVFFFSLENGQ